MKRKTPFGRGFWGIWSVVTAIGVIILLLSLGFLRIPHANKFEVLVCSWCGKKKTCYQRWLLSFKTHERIAEQSTPISKALSPLTNTFCRHDYHQVYIDAHYYSWRSGRTGSGYAGGEMLIRLGWLANELQHVRATNAPLAQQIWHDIFLACNDRDAFNKPELEWLIGGHQGPESFAAWYLQNQRALRNERTNSNR